MAGHSKWANIRHRKSAQDSKRGKLFTRLIREITVAARSGSAPEENSRLRTALEKALAANMPRETINRAIMRGSGTGTEGNHLEEISYEGYGPFGVAILVDTMTENRNRTAAEVRHAFSKGGGKLGTDGSVSYLFKRCGDIIFESSTNADQVMEQIMELAVDCDAEDVLEEDNALRVITSTNRFASINEMFTTKGFTPQRAEITMLPETTINIDALAELEKFMVLLEALDDLDDVCHVYHNANFTQLLWDEYANSEHAS